MSDKTPSPVTAMSAEQFAEFMSKFSGNLSTNLGQEIAKGIDQARPRKVTAGEYDPRSSFHPNKKRRKRLTRNCYQNGSPINDDQTHDAEIELLNRITRSGRYIERLVEVIVRNEGAEETVEIRYRNKTVDDRLQNSQHWRNFLDMLTKIVAEQDAALAEEGRQVEERKARASFSTKATLEARARAAADSAASQPLEP